MKNSLTSCLLLFIVLSTAVAEDLGEKRLMPDTVVMNDGRVLHGLIVKNDAEKVILQERMSEVEIPKNVIRRIDDQGQSGVYFADILDPGKLPPWRMIVQDLRSDDSIRSFKQIPATTIDNGYLRNIPYLSFKINDRIEMNVYGDPEHPVCLEYGIYERGEKITRFKKIIRAYLAGILTNRKEIEALYSLDEKGGMIRGGRFVFRITPPEAPDAYGGWWLSIYDPARLDKARLSDREYRKVTLLFNEVNNANGTVRYDRSMALDKYLSSTRVSWNAMIPDLRGFYRNYMGELELLVPAFMKSTKTSNIQ